MQLWEMSFFNMTVFNTSRNIHSFKNRLAQYAVLMISNILINTSSNVMHEEMEVMVFILSKAPVT